jgi:hypothetical protein
LLLGIAFVDIVSTSTRPGYLTSTFSLSMTICRVDHLFELTESALKFILKIIWKQRREMEQASRCTTCRNLVVESHHLFDVSIEDVILSSAKCSICFLLYQAAGISHGVRKSPVRKIQIVKYKSEQGPLLILKSDDSNDKGAYEVVRLFNTNPGL